MRSPNHYYYTGGSSLFKVFRLGIRLAIFVVAPLVLLSLGRTEGLFPRLKTPNSTNPNPKPIGEGFGFVIFIDYPNFNGSLSIVGVKS